MASSAGTSKALVYTPISPMNGEQLTPPTGTGSVARSDTGFLSRRGCRFEQVEPASRVALPVVVESEDRNARLNPRRRAVVVVEHLASGGLVGSTSC